MRDRLVTAAGALLIVFLAVGLVLQPSGEPPAARPLRDEAGAGGYLALRQWIEHAGVPTVSLRRRFSALLAPDAAVAPPSGNILIVTMPQVFRVRVEEAAALRDWLSAGNTMLIMAALDDTPKWAGEWPSMYFLSDLKALTGLSFAPVDTSAATRDGTDANHPGEIAEAGQLELRAIPAHPLMQGIDRLETRSHFASSVWDVEPLTDELAVRLARESGTGAGAIWQVFEGQGQIVVVAAASLLTNEAIGAAENRRFIANLIRFHLGPDGAVLFDDMHQGRSELYDPEAFFADSRLHRSAAFIVAWWFLWVVGSSNRLAPRRDENRGPLQGDWVEAVGGFMARHLDAAEAGQLMIERWLEDLGIGWSRSSGEPGWEELRAVPTVAERAVDEIERCWQKVRRGEEVDLVKLHNTLRRARRDMA